MLLPIEKPTKNWKVLLTPAESFTAFSDVCSDFESIFSALIEKKFGSQFWSNIQQTQVLILNFGHCLCSFLTCNQYLLSSVEKRQSDCDVWAHFGGGLMVTVDEDHKQSSCVREYQRWHCQ